MDRIPSEPFQALQNKPRVKPIGAVLGKLFTIQLFVPEGVHYPLSDGPAWKKANPSEPFQALQNDPWTKPIRQLLGALFTIKPFAPECVSCPLGQWTSGG